MDAKSTWIPSWWVVLVKHVVRSLNGSQGPSPLHGHGLGIVREVALVSKACPNVRFGLLCNACLDERSTLGRIRWTSTVFLASWIHFIIIFISF